MCRLWKIESTKVALSSPCSEEETVVFCKDGIANDSPSIRNVVMKSPGFYRIMVLVITVIVLGFGVTSCSPDGTDNPARDTHLTSPAGHSENELAPTPPMGWNSWNAFETDIDEQVSKPTE